MTKLLKRTDMCGEVGRDKVGQEVVLNGWVAREEISEDSYSVTCEIGQG